MYEWFIWAIGIMCEVTHRQYGCNSYCYWSCEHETFV